MSKELHKICVYGHFGFGKELLNGQTIKTKIITKRLEEVFGNDEVLKVDTHGGKKQIIFAMLTVFKQLRNSKNVLIFPGEKGLCVIAPILVLGNLFFHRRLHYIVIGGWLPEFIQKRKYLTKILRAFNYIYVETNEMKFKLECQGFRNIELLPNCKELKILQKNELVYSFEEPRKLCTFSRIMKEKGIEDAIEVVKIVNHKYGRIVYTLDIYGQIDLNQREWFDNLKEKFPDYIRYKGCVSYDKSVDVLKNYFLLLFPTYYDGEGFAGTFIDALAAGLPVISSDWKYNKEIVIEGVTGMLFPAKKVDDMVEKLEYAYENYQECFEMKKYCIVEAAKYIPSNAVNIVINHIL